jgi:hypothetical protein
MARDFEITRMTVRRDLKGLEKAEFPIFADTMDDGCNRWRVAGRSVAREARIKSGEVLLELGLVVAINGDNRNGNNDRRNDDGYDNRCRVCPLHRWSGERRQRLTTRRIVPVRVACPTRAMV